MTSVDVRNASGGTTGSVTLDERIFGLQPNTAVMHQVVTAQLAAARAGTQSTKTRAEVRGGGAKPWRQKGTGRARHGSIRSPQWRGGGVALGPKPRSYRQRTPKKMVRLALHSALSDRAAEGKVAVVDWGFTEPKTKAAVQALAALELDGRVLVVVGSDDDAVAKSFRNLQHVHVLPAGQLNAYDVLCSDWVVFTPATLPASADPILPPADAPEPPKPPTSKAKPKSKSKSKPKSKSKAKAKPAAPAAAEREVVEAEPLPETAPDTAPDTDEEAGS